MKCPECNGTVTRVVDSRNKEGGMEVYRRRKCVSCGTRFSTLECIIRKDSPKEEKLDW